MNLIPRKNKDIWWDPFDELDTWHKALNRIFDAPVASESWGPASGRIAVDVHETEDSLLVQADLPGFNKEDVKVFVQGNQLVIQAEKKLEEKEDKKGLIYSERFYGTVRRVIPLPSEVDSNKVKAAYKDGVLELKLSKREEAKPKQISLE